MYNKVAFKDLLIKIDNKESKKLQLPVVISLVDKLNKDSVEDEQLSQMLSDLYNLLYLYSMGNHSGKKQNRKLLRTIMSYAKKTYGYVQKGSYLAIFIGVGVAIGVGMFAWNTMLIGAGIAIGIGIGVAIGSSLEQKAEKEGKVY